MRYAHHIRIALACALLFGAPAHAAAPAAPAAAPAKVSIWTVDRQSSKIAFSSQFTKIPFTGTFKTWDAHIAFDPGALAASKVAVTIDLASAITGDQTRDEALPSTEWFDIVKFPKATFTTKSFKNLGGDRYEATADLTLHGVTKQVVLPFTLTVTGDRAAMKGALTIQRNAFNVGTGYFADADSVPFDVGISVTVNAQRAP